MSAPAWFERNLAEAPQRGTIEVAGCPIETLAWGKVGNRGLLLVHGNGAHADWWVPLAPFFSGEYRVGALSFSGMGSSGWRDRYSMAIYVEELIAASEALGLFAGAEKPWIVAHSLGGIAATYLSESTHGERFAGIILVDTGAVRPEDRIGMPPRTAPHPGYATLEEGMARFRLRPPQLGIGSWLLRFVAERSLQQRADGRWHWRFDPDGNLKRGREFIGTAQDVIPRARCPLAFIWGGESALMTQGSKALNREVAPPGTRFVEIPSAHHHLMFDQPIAFVTAVRALIA